jgi:hypothetical protein
LASPPRPPPPPAQPHLGVFPLCATAKSEKKREEKERKKRRRGKEKGSGAPPRRHPGTSGREPRRCREELRAPLPRSAAPLERTLSTPTPRHGRRCGRSKGRLGRRELLRSAAVFIKPASTTPPPLCEHAAAPWPLFSLPELRTFVPPYEFVSSSPFCEPGFDLCLV